MSYSKSDREKQRVYYTQFWKEKPTDKEITNES